MNKFLAAALVAMGVGAAVAPAHATDFKCSGPNQYVTFSGASGSANSYVDTSHPYAYVGQDAMGCYHGVAAASSALGNLFQNFKVGYTFGPSVKVSVDGSLTYVATFVDMWRAPAVVE